MATYLESVEAQRKKREGQPIVKPWVDRTRQEFAEMSGRAFAGSPEVRQVYEQGRDAIMRGPQTPPAPEEYRSPQRPVASPVGAQRRTFSGDIQEIGGAIKRVGEFLPKPAYSQMFENRGVIADETRKKRIEQAGYPSETQRRPNMPQEAPEAPVMANSQREPNRSRSALATEPPPQEGGLGNVPAGQVLKEKAGVTTSAAASGRVPASSSDPRSRYMSMAKMGLEEREKYLNSLPAGQRPIQVIRGNTESWYSPGMSREFATIPEAMSGVQGRPTYQSEEERAEKATGRASMSSRQQSGFAHQKGMQAAEFAHQEKMAKDFGITSLKGGKGSARGAGGEKWKVDITADQDGRPVAFMSDESSGKNVQVKIGDANSVAGALPNFNMEDSRTRQLALDMLNGLGDMAAIESTYKNQPEHVQTAILQAIKERKESEKKK